MPGQRWTPEQLQLLRQHYPHMSNADVARIVGRDVLSIRNKSVAEGLRKSADYLASVEVVPGTWRTPAGRLGKGVPSHNKGTKVPQDKQAKNTATRFRKGDMRGPNHHKHVPIGTERLSYFGYLERKVSDDHAKDPARRWVPVHRLVWEAAHGPVPDGHVVVFRPRRRTAVRELITVDGLELVSRNELLQRNRPTSPELAQLVALKAQITRQVNRIVRETKEIQP